MISLCPLEIEVTFFKEEEYYYVNALELIDLALIDV